MTTIRPLAPTDFDHWLPLWRGYLTFYKTAVTDEVTKLSFQRLTSGAEQMGGFIAFDDAGSAVGVTHWITHRSTWTTNDYCYLQDLFVDSDKRGGGVGKALIEAVYAKGKELGCPRVYWLTHETNVQAMTLYDKVAKKSGFLHYRKDLS
jgi:GNAT superfamily N-acetyltransferase